MRLTGRTMRYIGLALAPPKDREGMICTSPGVMLQIDFPERNHSLRRSAFDFHLLGTETTKVT